MPELENKEPVPQQMEFDNGLLSDASTLANDPNITAHSNMDQPEAADPNKERVAQGVRNTLLARMIEENTKSDGEAADVKRDHDEYRDRSLFRVKESVQNDMRKAVRAEISAQVAEAGLHPGLAQYAISNIDYFSGLASGAGISADADFFDKQKRQASEYRDKPKSERYRRMFREGSAGSKRRKAAQALNDAKNSLGNVRKAADAWNDELRKYYDTVYRPRSQAYDRMFLAYYTMGRELPDDAAGNPGNRIDPNSAKRIKEYTGKFSDNSITAFEQGMLNNGAIGDPYRVYQMGYEPGTSKDASPGRFEGLNKIHIKVNAEGFNGVRNYVDEQSVPDSPPRLRYKITSDYGTFLSAKQYDDHGDLVADDDADTQTRQEIGDVGLTQDEVGVNGRRIYSQKSAKIYKRKTKSGGEVEGFFVGGEFVPADDAYVRNQGGYTRFSNESDSEMADQEKVRTAIRRSDFFKHINAATIQYYMKYNGYNDQGAVQMVNRVERSYMARKDRTVSKTGIGQSVVNGEYARFIGGLGGIAVSAGGLDDSGKDPEWAIDWGKYTAGPYAKAFGDFAEYQSELLNFKENPVVASIIANSNVALAVAGGIGGIVPGLSATAMLQRLMGMGKCVLDGLYACKAIGTAKETGESRKLLVLRLAGAGLEFLQDISDIVYLIIQLDPTGLASQIISLARDFISFARNLVNAIVSGQTAYQINSMQDHLKSVVQIWKSGDLSDPGLFAEGRAYSQNAQAGLLLKLAKDKNVKESATSGIDAATSGLNIVSTGTAMAGHAEVSLGFKIASKVTSFISFAVSKMSDRSERKDIIGEALGDRNLNDVSGFNTVLKEETGINNKYYLNDLARAFMAIDMHAMAMKITDDEGEKNLVIDTLKTFIPKPDGMDFDHYKEKIRFDAILKAIGAPGNWRSVLLESIST